MDAFLLFLSTRYGSLRGEDSLGRRERLCVEEACGQLPRQDLASQPLPCAFGLDGSSFSETRYLVLNLGITRPSSPVLEADVSVSGGERA